MVAVVRLMKLCQSLAESKIKIKQSDYFGMKRLIEMTKSALEMTSY